MSSRDLAPTFSDATQRHTPGPWVQKMQFGEWFVRQDPAPADWSGMGYQLICSLPAAKKGSHYGDMFAANARLIAAAPDLLEAVKALLPEGWGDDDTMDHMPGVKLARAAIAKAEVA